MLFFLIIFSLHLFVEFASVSLDQTNETCLLPFVTKPCVNNGKILSCTFSLHSAQRSRTCNFSSIALYFTTSEIELFLIPQYYNQIISIKKNYIARLTIEPNVTNQTFEYLHWSPLRISSIQFPYEIQEFVLIHDKNNLEVFRVQDERNKKYWHIDIWPSKTGRCEKTVFARNNFTTTPYNCSYFIDCGIPLCGVSYACLDQKPCYPAGFRRLVCQTDMIRLRTKFYPISTVSQYDTIFISVYNEHSYVLNEIDQNIFLGSETNSDKASFITKNLVVIINNGILQVPSKLFDNPNRFRVRIEHGECSIDKFQVDILNDTADSVINNFIDYTNNRTGAVGCRLNITDPQVVNHYAPKFKMVNIPVLSAGVRNSVYIWIESQVPSNMTGFRNGTSPQMIKPSDMTVMIAGDASSMIIVNISNTTKDDNGIEYHFTVTNRFGQASASADLVIAYGPVFTVLPQNQTVKKGSNVILEAQIDGYPTPDVSIESTNFRQTLQPINNNQHLYQYNLSKVQLNDSAPYTFSALSQAHSTNISKTVFLTVFDSLYPTNLTNSISVEEEEPLNLTVQFSHSIVKTQWFVNNVRIENTSADYTDSISNDQAILHISNTSVKYNGQYNVQVWDILDQTNQSTITVHIHSLPPSIFFCNDGITQNELYSYLICRFQGKYPRIQWTDPSNRIISGHSNYEIFNATAHIFDARLIFKELQYTHFGNYTFQVNNNGGHVRRTINFPLKKMAPMIGNHTFTWKKIYVSPGDSHTFHVFLNGIPWPNITFFFNNKSLLSYSNFHTSPASLSLKNLSIDHEGIYYARVMNSEGFNETNRTELCILQAPSFITQTQSSYLSMISIKPNQTITLTTPKIKPGSLHPLKLVWYVKGQSIKLPFNSSMLQSELTINSSLQQELIACVIENRMGESAHFFKLNYLQAPQFLLALKKQTEVELNQTIVLTVFITGNPLPTIQWFRNRQIIDNTQREERTTSSSGVYSLIITNLTLMDIGNYTVVAKNGEKEISSETQMILKSSSGNSYGNEFPTSQPTLLAGIIPSTRRLRPMRGENMAHIIITILMLGLIVLLLVPIFCKQKILSQWSKCRKKKKTTTTTKKIDDNHLLKPTDENNTKQIDDTDSIDSDDESDINPVPPRPNMPNTAHRKQFIIYNDQLF